MPIYLTRRLKCHSARGLGWRIEVRWRRGYRDVDGDEDGDGFGDEQTQSPKRNFHEFIELRECEK